MGACRRMAPAGEAGVAGGPPRGAQSVLVQAVCLSPAGGHALLHRLARRPPDARRRACPDPRSPATQVAALRLLGPGLPPSPLRHAARSGHFRTEPPNGLGKALAAE